MHPDFVPGQAQESFCAANRKQTLILDASQSSLPQAVLPENLIDCSGSPANSISSSWYSISRTDPGKGNRPMALLS